MSYQEGQKGFDLSQRQSWRGMPQVFHDSQVCKHHYTALSTSYTCTWQTWTWKLDLQRVVHLLRFIGVISWLQASAGTGTWISTAHDFLFSFTHTYTQWFAHLSFSPETVPFCPRHVYLSVSPPPTETSVTMFSLDSDKLPYQITHQKQVPWKAAISCHNTYNQKQASRCSVSTHDGIGNKHHVKSS